MIRLNDFRIPAQSSSNEVQEYDFKIDDSFFAHFEYGDIEGGDLQVKIKVIYSSRQIKLDLRIKGDVEIVCDRCLDTYRDNLDANFVLYGKFGHGADEEDIDVIWIPEDRTYIDLIPVFFDYINISLPLRRVHPEDEEGNSLCNVEMINRLKELGVNQENEFE